MFCEQQKNTPTSNKKTPAAAGAKEDEWAETAESQVQPSIAQGRRQSPCWATRDSRVELGLASPSHDLGYSS